MALISVVGAKGGSGVSLLATNLGVALAAENSCLLIDLNPLLGSDDLLLDIQVERSWFDLLPVAGELTEHHINLAAGYHPSGLRLLSAPHKLPATIKCAEVTRLLYALKKRFAWLLLDLPVANVDMASLAFPVTDSLLLVSLMDPLSLRSARRLTEVLPTDLLRKTGIVFNQVTSDHPADPGETASSLEMPLLAVLPADHDMVGRQVNFGRPCVGDASSPFGEAVVQLAGQLVHAGFSFSTGRKKEGA
jgi:Flp pilus assembly CpaE family ATPase